MPFKFVSRFLIMVCFLASVSAAFAGVNFVGSGGGNGDSLVAPDHASFRNMPALTIAAWVNRTGGGGGGDRIVSGWNDSTNKKTFQFYLNGSNLAMEINCDTTDVNFQPSSALTNGVWYHLVAVYTGETLYLYKDGVEIANTTTPSGDIVDETSGVGIGSQPDRTDFGMLNALVSEVAIWNDDLTASEVALLYGAKVKGMPLQIRPDALVLYLPLDDYPEGESLDGDIVYDRVGRHQFTGNDGSNNTGLTSVAEKVLTYP